jgi:hypothetical protein
MRYHGDPTPAGRQASDGHAEPWPSASRALAERRSEVDRVRTQAVIVIRVDAT